MAIEGSTATARRKIRLGMVGGGNEALIGAVHRIAARLDDRYEFVAGALSSTPERSAASGAALGLAPDRTYPDFLSMAKREARLKDGIDAVAIVTPNHMHAGPAIEFLKRGIHVICDKPLTATMAEARKLEKAVAKADSEGTLFFFTHNYTAYPMIRQARAMVASGRLGKIRLVQAEYPQDWLARDIEKGGQKQAAWRTDPARSGMGGCVGDIGTHAYNLGNFVSGLRATSLAADLDSFVPGRALDDNAHILMRYEGGAKGMIWSSQMAVGHENGMRLRVYGEDGALEWIQVDPGYLAFTALGEPRQILTRAGAGATPENHAAGRIPAGHPEGYLEGFANIYREAADAMLAVEEGQRIDSVVPGIQDGMDGMRFIEACVTSSKRNAAWVKL